MYNKHNIIQTITKTTHIQYIINNFPYITPQQLSSIIFTILSHQHKNISVLIKNNTNNSIKHLKYNIRMTQINKKFTTIKLSNIINKEIMNTINKYS